MALHHGETPQGPTVKWRVPSNVSRSLNEAGSQGGFEQDERIMRDAFEKVHQFNRNNPLQPRIPRKQPCLQETSPMSNATPNTNVNADATDTSATDAAIALKKSRRANIVRTIGRVALTVFTVGGIALAGAAVHAKMKGQSLSA